MRPLLLINAESMRGDLPDLVARHGDYRQLFAAAMQWPESDMYEVFAHQGDEIPALDQRFCGAIITGAAAMVSDGQPWIAGLGDWIRAHRHSDKPILGVCFGHQILAHALGGSVTEQAQTREWGSYTISISEAGRLDPLCARLPAQHIQQQAHHQSVDGLPEGATVLASNPSGIQMVRYGAHIWGTQFHPEFHADFQRDLLPCIATSLSARGVNVAQCQAGIQSHQEGQLLLQNFVRLLREPM